MIALDMYCWHAFVDPPEKTVHYYPTEQELKEAKAILKPLRNVGKKVITLLPHASTIYKDYPHWFEVIKLCPLNYFWIVLDSFQRPKEPWSGSNIVNMSGLFKTRQAIALVIEADLNCSSDTGMLYPKVARGGKAIVTYGPHEYEPFLHYFPSAHGMRIPYLTKTTGMEGMCSTGCFIDTSSCRKQGTVPPCLQELEPKIVAEKIMSLLEK
jgi:hypothetical protein